MIYGYSLVGTKGGKTTKSLLGQFYGFRVFDCNVIIKNSQNRIRE